MSILMITLDDRPGGSGPVFGVVGWVRSRFGGDRVGVVPYWGWTGGSGQVLGVTWWVRGSGPVLGVAGWEWSGDF
jgi:hypothetical protein